MIAIAADNGVMEAVPLGKHIEVSVEDRNVMAADKCVASLLSALDQQRNLPQVERGESVASVAMLIRRRPSHVKIHARQQNHGWV